MLKFTKMHGIGNCYIYINCFEEEVFNPNKLSEFVSDFHFAPKAGDQFFGRVLYERDRSGDGGISI